jgi:hypothetical protein
MADLPFISYGLLLKNCDLMIRRLECAKSKDLEIINLGNHPNKQKIFSETAVKIFLQEHASVLVRLSYINLR